MMVMKWEWVTNERKRVGFGEEEGEGTSNTLVMMIMMIMMKMIDDEFKNSLKRIYHEKKNLFKTSHNAECI